MFLYCGTNRELHEQRGAEHLFAKMLFCTALNEVYIITTVLTQVSSAPLLKLATGVTYSKWTRFSMLHDPTNKQKLAASIHIPPDSTPTSSLPPLVTAIYCQTCRHFGVLRKSEFFEVLS